MVPTFEPAAASSYHIHGVDMEDWNRRMAARGEVEAQTYAYVPTQNFVLVLPMPKAQKHNGLFTPESLNNSDREDIGILVSIGPWCENPPAPDGTGVDKTRVIVTAADIGRIVLFHKLGWTQLEHNGQMHYKLRDVQIHGFYNTVSAPSPSPSPSPSQLPTV